MAKVILTSTSALWNPANSALYPEVQEAFAKVTETNAVFVVSNHAEPTWLKASLPKAKFQRFQKRQGGGLVKALIEANKARYPTIALDDFVVVGASDLDMQMAAQERVLLLRCAWGTETGRWTQYGVPIRKPAELDAMVTLFNAKEPWYFTGQAKNYDVFALTNAGTHGEGPDHVALAEKLRGYLKQDSKPLRGVQLHLLSSVYVTPKFLEADVWGFYPSSTPKQDTAELMGHVTRAVREPLNRRSAKVGEPLLVRHRATLARHKSGGNREDPTGQLESVHVNPTYAGKLRNKRVAIVDDYLTYGVSFGVAAALLRRAGAASVTCLAMGKFGFRAQDFDIEVLADPFAPLQRHQFRVVKQGALNGTNTREAQLELLTKFSDTLLW